ncbi:MAG: FAD-dependent oxidoreductase, partial [Lachnospiraceae bacterium]|nr:FAD-dependent oxidoreductase [Lachnospiraceae bacterium]
GAQEEILYDGRAHIGTDVIRRVVVNIRKEIERLGGEVRFNTQFVKPEIKDGELCGVYIKLNKPREKCDAVSENADGSDHNYGSDKGECEYVTCSNLILAIGHSARDTYEMLHSLNFPMEAKAFAVGFRVIHKAKYINECQYGEGYEERYPNLPTAYYKLTYQAKTGKNVYSFCMCPGGYVVNASSEEERLAINGMSNAARDGEYSNAAMVMNVGPEEFGSNDVLAGMHYQRRLEETAYKLGEGKIPVQFYKDFENAVRQNENEALEIKTLGNEAIANNFNEKISIKDISGSEKSSGIYGEIKTADLSKLFTNNMNRSFVEGMQHFNHSMKGYADVNPLLCGVESRTSAPIRILRDEDFQSLSVKGIYPCGEGAGYAGGITSAAIDGLKVAEAVCSNQDGEK